MNTLRTLFLCTFLASGCLAVRAHDFAAMVDGREFFFNITNKLDFTVEITFEGSIADRPQCRLSGEVELPAKVKYNDKTYTVTTIGRKAFSGASEITSIVLPATLIKIDDFAFEGCTALSRVVFPGSPVAMGQGTFFKCTALRDLSFGSDWKTLDLTPYRWSDSLQVITIPARVTKVQNMKSLRALRQVSVDVNNTHFFSAGGVLYSRDGKTLYGVPRGYAGRLEVSEGTEVVTPGALIDCPDITSIVFPASLRELSFRETSRMAGLTFVAFKSETPVVTARTSGKDCFLIAVANPKVNIFVPKVAKKAYAQSLAGLAPGEYAETDSPESIPYEVTATELPSAKNLNGVKDFSNL